MKGYEWEYELYYIIWCGIHGTLEKAIERKDVEALKSLKEAVEFYNKEFLVSGKELENLLSELESLKEE